MTRRRRLIEVAFPLEEVSAHSRREKNVRHGHISTLHIWWARRPLAACRAFIYASLVDDPDTDAEREALLKEVADLASWDAVRKPDQVVRKAESGGSGLTGHDLLERARRRILTSNGGKPPRLLDPFSGGGAIPLEALRLGCEVEASDLNPVAVLILKGTVEYPQKYGRPLGEQRTQLARGERDAIAGVNGDVPEYIREAGRLNGSAFGEEDAVTSYKKNPLAADVRYWGTWMLERARTELAEFYPPDPDGSVPVAYLWSRTVPCPNCKADMPLIRQYWLGRKDQRRVALRPVVDQVGRHVDFEVVAGPNVTGDPAEATTSRGDTICLICRQVLKADAIRDAGRRGLLGAALTAVVVDRPGARSRGYRADEPRDAHVASLATKRLALLASTEDSEVTIRPDEPITPGTLGLRVDAFGISEWGQLFSDRQILALSTFAQAVQRVGLTLGGLGASLEYTTAVCTYLALAVDRLADRLSTLARWDSSPKMEAISNTFSRQALSMVWDYAEGIPLSDSSGGFETCISWINAYLEIAPITSSIPQVIMRDARATAGSYETIITDPPYYNSIDYAGLSDFFYVWLKRSLGPLQPDLLTMPLTPKRGQAIMDSERDDPEAKARYVGAMGASFDAIARSSSDRGVVGVVFAHSDQDAWATLIQGLLAAGLTPTASWPIDTELANKTSAASRANLQTSVWMACRPREASAGDAFLGDVLTEMRLVIRDRLLDFWARSIRGADFFISAIGPGLSVFGRHKRVLQPDGSEVSVRDFLDLVRRESTQVALEQVLGGTDLGLIDPTTRQFVTWVWSYSRAPLDTGEALALCLATGADYREIVRDGSIAIEAREASKKLAKLRTIKERGEREEDLGVGTAARPAPLVDQLQKAAWLWGQNRPDQIAALRAGLGEARWQALRTLGQAVAECLPQGDEDRRLINGLLGSAAASGDAPAPGTLPDRTHTMQMFDSEV